ncbi:MAG: hypothetical protein HZC41_02925 [Chloroflexi bacterium]|nr:hypothetical protein [Chloroflexota bacterium]
MFRPLVLVLLVLLLAGPTAAQPDTPDYAVRLIRGRFSADGRQAVVEFEVQNIGATATVPATARLVVIATGQEVSTASIPPLAATEIRTVSLPFSTAGFAPRSVESLRAAVGINEVEAAGSENIQNNYAQISLTFPAVIPPEATPEATPADETARLLERLRLNDPTQMLVIAGLVGALLVVLLIAWLILRLLFRRPPDFSNWQPAYGSLFPLDPNSTAGRRQQWQSLAQNNSLPPIGTEGSVHACKRLFGIDGTYLSGWHITAVRASQYDMYGRINRSQVLAPRRLVRRLDAVVQRKDRLTGEQIERRLRPVARGLVGKLRGRFNNRNAMLPIALDLRFQGRHGEVRILFELYQCQYGQWHLLDQWEPEMTISGKSINEAYTYTFYGQRPGETIKTFSQRLQDDLVRTLAEMVRPQVFGGDTSPTPVPTQNHVPKVE